MRLRTRRLTPRWRARWGRALPRSRRPLLLRRLLGRRSLRRRHLRRWLRRLRRVRLPWGGLTTGDQNGVCGGRPEGAAAPVEGEGGAAPAEASRSDPQK